MAWKTVGKTLEKLIPAELIAEKIEESFQRGMHTVEKRLHQGIKRLHKHIFAVIVNSIILVASLGLVVVGAMMWVSKYIPLEYVFIFVGLLGLIYLALSQLKISMR